MNPKIKDLLGIAGIIAVIILIVGTVKFTNAYSRSAPPVATFSATGEGRVTAVPDTAEWNFGILTEGGKDIAALQAENTTKTNAAIGFVKSKGVDAKDITTENYSISPRYETTSCPPVPMLKPCTNSTTIVGYAISQTIDVKVHDFSKIGDLMSGVAAQGANNISGLQFTVHDKTEVENEARAKAVAEAERKAAALAEAGHFRLGRIISIQEGNAQPIYYGRDYSTFDKGLGGGAAAAPAPAIEPGSQELVSNVTITYEIN